VIPSERDETSQVWIYCGGGEESRLVAAGESTVPLFSVLRFAESIDAAQQNWMDGLADLLVNNADGTDRRVPTLKKGFQIRYTGALLSADGAENDDVFAELYGMPIAP